MRETADELVLRDVEDREVTLPVDAIEARQEGGSLMPVGLADELTRGELVDLVRFLSALGKVGPYAVGNARVARRWETPVQDSQVSAAMNTDGGLDADKLSGLNWTSVYSTVSGDVPLSEIPTCVGTNGHDGRRLVRCRLEVAAGGPIGLAARGPVEKLWIDGRAVEEIHQATVELAPGIHTVMLLLGGKPDDRLRLEMVDVGDSQASAQFVGGK